MADPITIKDILTIGLGAVGAVLGIMNTWSSMNQRRVKLAVRPSAATNSNGQKLVAIEVINRSAFAVTVDEVGFSGHWRGIKHGIRSAVPMPIIIDGKSWPRRLEAREAVTVYMPLANLMSEPRKPGKAYASTSCREVSYGDSPALKNLRKSWGQK